MLGEGMITECMFDEVQVTFCLAVNEMLASAVVQRSGGGTLAERVELVPVICQRS